MSNKTDIEVLEEMKYQLQVRNKKIENDIYDNEIFASEYEDNNQKIQAIENILADRGEKEKYISQIANMLNIAEDQIPIELAVQLTKANKYDSLVEKINNKFEYAENLLKETAKGNLQRYTPSELIFMMKILQELLDVGKE